MGCDIHLHIEVKLNGKWEHYAAPRIDRDYRLFTKMAGVRQCCNMQCLASPRGLPNDITVLTRYDCERMGSDGHDHSWLGKEEIRILSHFIEVLKDGWYNLEYHVLHCYLFENSFDIVSYPEGVPIGVEDVRFVFWFDN